VPWQAGDAPSRTSVAPSANDGMQRAHTAHAWWQHRMSGPCLARLQSWVLPHHISVRVPTCRDAGSISVLSNPDRAPITCLGQALGGARPGTSPPLSCCWRSSRRRPTCRTPTTHLACCMSRRLPARFPCPLTPLGLYLAPPNLLDAYHTLSLLHEQAPPPYSSDPSVSSGCGATGRHAVLPHTRVLAARLLASRPAVSLGL